MKRRRRFSEANPKKSSPIQRSSLAGGFYGVWSSNTKTRPTTTTTSEIEQGPVISAFPKEVTEAPKSDGPKTSEYAFFKKLKKNAGKPLHAYSLEKEGDQFKKPVSNDCDGEDMTDKVKRSFRNLKTSCQIKEGNQFKKPLLNEYAGGDMTDKVKGNFKNLKTTCNVYPINLDSFSSPQPGPSKSLDNIKTIKHNQKSSALFEKVVPVNFDSFPSPFEGPSKRSGMQNWPDDIFSAKRQRLRQSVANTISFDIDELHSQGYNMVSVLLSRLFPESKENNCLESEDPKLKRRDIDIDSEYESLILPNAVSDFNKPWWTTLSEHLKPEYMINESDNSLAGWSNTSRNITLSKWDTLGCDSPASHAYETHYQDILRQNDLELYSGITRTANHSGFCLDSPVSNHHRNLDEIYCPTKSSFGRQPHTFLLDWKSDAREQHGIFCDSRNTELSLYDPSPSTSLNNSYWHKSDNHAVEQHGISCDSRSNELSLYDPTLSTSLNNSHWHKSDNDASELCLRPFLNTSYTRNFTSPLHLPSANYCNLDFERHVFEDKNDLDSALNRFPLTLLFSQNYLDLADGCRHETTYKGFPNHLLLVREASCDKYLPNMETLLTSTGLDYGIERKWLSMTNSLSKHQSSTFPALEYPQEESKHLYLSSKESESCKNHLPMENLLTYSGLDYGLEQKWLSMNNSFGKHHSSTFHALEYPQEESKHSYLSSKEYESFLDGSDQI